MNTPWSKEACDMFWANADVNGTTLPPGQKLRCWNWTGTTVTQTGQGVVRLSPGVDGKPFAEANRFVWQLFNGAFKDPEAVDVSIACHNPRCCNPDHLKLVDAHNHNRVLCDHSKHPVTAVAPIVRHRLAA